MPGSLGSLSRYEIPWASGLTDFCREPTAAAPASKRRDRGTSLRSARWDLPIDVTRRFSPAPEWPAKWPPEFPSQSGSKPRLIPIGGSRTGGVRVHLAHPDQTLPHLGARRDYEGRSTRLCRCSQASKTAACHGLRSRVARSRRVSQPAPRPGSSRKSLISRLQTAS